jgi:predicted DNA-binding transcriptional regulator AlpA
VPSLHVAQSGGLLAEVFHFNLCKGVLPAMGLQRSAPSSAYTVSPNGLSEQTAVPIASVYRWNRTGTGPPFVRVGRHVRYRQSDIDSWLAARHSADLGAA